jgi:quinol-cytochrome oxidoreductase complex cytochrome b subunit
MMHAVPFVGEYLMTVLRGGEEVTGATIGRFFGLHVAILPALFTMLHGLHLLLVQRQGMSEPIEWHDKQPREKKFMKFFPNFLYRDILVWLVALNVLALLAVIFPDGIGVFHWPLGEKADPFAPPPAVIRPEWYFMFAFQTLKLIPARVLFIEGEQFGMLVMGIGGVVWALVPFFDKKAQLHRRSTGWMLFGALIVLFIIVMTILGYTIE